MNESQIETEVSDLDYLVPDKLYSLPESSQYINQEWLEILDKLCTTFGYSMEGEASQQLYIESVIGILNTATSLNLMEEGREDYTLHFNRLSKIILLVLHEINTMRVEDVCIFYELIKRSLSSQIYNNLKSYPYSSAFCFLAMNDNADIEDYKMFENENSFQIKTENLWKLMLKNVHNNSNYVCLKRNFRRLSYLESKEMELNK